MTPESPQSFDYHGWKGNGDSWVSAYFTGATGEWLLNDEALYHQVHRICRSEDNVKEASEALQTWMSEDVMGELLARDDLASDLLGTILHGEINWTEIAAAFRADP